MSDSFHDLLDMNISFALWHELFYFHSYTNDNILEADINVFIFMLKKRGRTDAAFRLLKRVFVFGVVKSIFDSPSVTVS